METIRMSKKESKYAKIIAEVVAGKLRQSQAAIILQLSLRQVKRLCSKYKSEGLKGLCHQGRGRISNNKMKEDLRLEILGLIKKNYSDFGPQLIREQLNQRHGIVVSKEWIRQSMIQEGIWTANKRKHQKLYQRRNRRSRKGELVQVDGSYHKWFEDRGEKCCLIVAIDDATSEILELLFVPHESTEAYMKVMKMYVKSRGCPVSIYSDRLNVFAKNGQLARALAESEIGLIHAQTPQAKGRVERANATLQDRLIKLMRLEGISSIEEGNKYLAQYRTEHNMKFARKPKDPSDAHRELNTELDIERVFCKKDTRKISKDLSIAWNGKTYILKNPSSPNRMRKKEAKVFELEGEVCIEIDGKDHPYEIYEEQQYQAPGLNRKELDAVMDKKPRMSNIQRLRRNRRGV